MTGLSNEALGLWYGGRNQIDWRCEEHLIKLLNSFIKQWPECKPIGPRARRSLVVSARDLHEELGEKPDFMEWAKEKIRRDSPHLTIKSLRSLLFLVPEWRTRKTEGNDEYWD